MENQVFLFGSFSEDEASHFQFSPKSAAKQNSAKLPSKESHGSSPTHRGHGIPKVHLKQPQSLTESKAQSNGFKETIKKFPAHASPDAKVKLRQSADNSFSATNSESSSPSFVDQLQNDGGSVTSYSSGEEPSRSGLGQENARIMGNGNYAQADIRIESDVVTVCKAEDHGADEIALKRHGNGHNSPMTKPPTAHFHGQTDSHEKDKVIHLTADNGSAAKELIQVTDSTGETWLQSLKELDTRGKRLQPRGLINTGTSCFLNATLQALISCSPFVHLLHVLQAQGIPQVGFPALLACIDFMKEFELQHDDRERGVDSFIGKPFVPVMFNQLLQTFSRQQPSTNSGRNRQEDAQEFLSFMIDKLHEELIGLAGKSNTSRTESFPMAGTSEVDDWETVGPKRRTAVVRTHTFTESAVSSIFGGQLYSVVKSKGVKASATIQPFFVLQLDILSEAVHTLEDTLRLFSAPECLEGYKTSAGKAAAVNASKSVKLQSLPRVLILHLMRFSYGAQGSSKLFKALQFPLTLTLGRDLLVNPLNIGFEARRYELVATVTHHGKDPFRGHYTTDSKQPDGQWLRYNDGCASIVGPEQVLQEQAYILFYKRLINI